MAVAAERLLDTEDALDAAYKEVAAGATVPEAAIAIYRRGLRPDAVASFAISGIINRLNERLSRDRAAAFRESGADVTSEIGADRGSAPVGRNQPKAVHHAMAWWEQKLLITYWTPDGRKRLLDFTLADTRGLMAKFEAQADTARRRREALRLAEKLLVARKVDFIRSLPADDKAAIAEALR